MSTGRSSTEPGDWGLPRRRGETAQTGAPGRLGTCYLAWHRRYLIDPAQPLTYVLVPIEASTWSGFRNFHLIGAAGEPLDWVIATRFSLRCLRSDETADGSICPVEGSHVRGLLAKAGKRDLPEIICTVNRPAWSGWPGNPATVALLRSSVSGNPGGSQEGER